MLISSVFFVFFFWSTIPLLVLTNQTIASYLKSLKKKQKKHWKSTSWLGTGRVNPVNESQPSAFGNWISNCNTDLITILTRLQHIAI
jgi:hypothetical protein